MKLPSFDAVKRYWLWFSLGIVVVSFLTIGRQRSSAPASISESTAVVDLAPQLAGELEARLESVVPEPDLAIPTAIQIEQSVGTEQMYAAHASLRSDEVANPDSESNRRILQEMVVKALKRERPAPNN